jgi:hypothetical protein
VASITIAGIVFAFAFGGVLLGMSLREVLPESHLTHDSKDVIRVATGLLATLAALVLGLLVASAKASFDAQENGFQQLSANIVMLDRALAHYGPGASKAREALHRAVTSTIDRLWPAKGDQSSQLDAPEITAEANTLYAAIQDLAPSNDAQRAVQSQALQIGTDLARTRWLLSQQQDSTSSAPFLTVLVFWLSAIFASFGLFAPWNRTVITVFFVSALSTAGAIFLIVDLNQPTEGLIQVSNAPLRYAVSQLGQ